MITGDGNAGLAPHTSMRESADDLRKKQVKNAFSLSWSAEEILAIVFGHEDEQDDENTTENLALAYSYEKTSAPPNTS